MLVGGEVNMVKITITVGGKPVEMTIEEARTVRDQLAALFGGVSTPLPYSPTPFNPIGSPVPPWTVTCGVAEPAR